MAGIQGSNAFVPLLIVPYGLSVVGFTTYAQLAITEAISTLALAVVLFSFDIEGVARVTRMGPEKPQEALGDILSQILSARLLLFATIAPLILFVFWVANGGDVLFMALWLLVPLGQIFHAYWFYQAIEDNIVPAAITFLSRVVTVGMVLGFVHGPEDAALIPLAIGGPFVVGGILSTIHIVRHFGLSLRWVGLRPILADLWHGKEIFAGNLSVSLYREMNVVVMGIVGVPAAGISAYALLEKTIKMIQACTRPLNQLFFPKVLRALSSETRPTLGNARVVARYTWPQLALVLALIVSLPGAYWAASIAFPRLLEFTALPHLEIMAAIMAPAILLGIMNFMFGSAGLNVLNQRPYFFVSILITGLVNIALCFALSWVFGTIGAAICFVLAEALLFTLVLARYLCGSASRAATAPLARER